MENNFNYCGGSNMMRKKIKIQEAAAAYMAQERKKKEDEEKALLEQEKLQLMNSANYANAYARRNRERAKRLQESLQYRENTTKNAMTEYIMQIVENSLLIDKDEYLKLNPLYEEETKSLIKGLLENAELNQNIKNKDTLTIMEHCVKHIPMVETGITLNEGEIVKLITSAENSKVEKAIDNLSSDIQDKVSSIVSSEQEKEQEIQNDLDKVIELAEAGRAKAVEKAAKEAEAEQEGVNAVEDITEKDIDEDGDIADEEDAETVEDEEVEDEIPTTPRRETSIEISTDGKIKVKTITEDKIFVNEVPKHGLIESLAVNEGMKMIEEGKAYNGDLALANTIRYLTVLEAFDTMGLFSFDDNKKRELITSAGGIELEKVLNK